MGIILSIFAALVALAVIYIAMIAPRCGDERDISHVFVDYAHRGLFDNKRAPENSLEAFRLAVHHGHGIELDVQLTADGQVVVFHDYTLTRMCGAEVRLSDLTYEQLCTYRLLNTEYTIPTLSQVLELVGGRVPILVELKGESTSTALCEPAAKLLDGYRGNVAIESFNPMLLRWFKLHRQDLVRGQLVTNLIAEKKKGSIVLNLMLSGLLLNFLSRPDFIACDIKHTGGPAFWLCAKVFGTKRFYWTVRRPEDFQAIRESEARSIFEGFLPRK